ncbi:MAG: hypothetical protein ACRDXE_10475 [Acidimicrobiales bacterium]
MSLTEPCELHELIGCTVCSVCSGKAYRESEQRQPDSRPFQARYPGQCRECNLPISAGERLVLRDYGNRVQVIHEWCA